MQRIYNFQAHNNLSQKVIYERIHSVYPQFGFPVQLF